MATAAARLKPCRPEFAQRVARAKRAGHMGHLCFLRAESIQNQTKLMPMNFLGKLLFPNLPNWQRRRQTRIILWAIALAVLIGAVVVMVMFYNNAKR